MLSCMLVTLRQLRHSPNRENREYQKYFWNVIAVFKEKSQSGVRKLRGQFQCPDLCCDWPYHNKHSWDISSVHGFSSDDGVSRLVKIKYKWQRDVVAFSLFRALYVASCQFVIPAHLPRLAKVYAYWLRYLVVRHVTSIFFRPGFREFYRRLKESVKKAFAPSGTFPGTFSRKVRRVSHAYFLQSSEQLPLWDRTTLVCI